MNETQARLRAAAAELFESGRIDLFLGHERGTLPFRSRPAFLEGPGQVERLVWDRSCVTNLAVYLPALFAPRRRNEEPPRVGIAARGCDSRSVLGLVKERQVPRERVVIVGLPCRGMVDPKKLPGGKGGALGREGGGGLDEAGLEEVEERLLQEACLECRHPEAVGADLLIEGRARPAAAGGFQGVDALAARSAEERWRYFEAEASKCIRCYACRQACPNCYCKVCFVDQGKPAWLDRGSHLSDVMLFQIGRAFHQAGRCVDCGACLRACPMGIDLRSFTGKLVKDVEELFGYTPGLSLEEPPPLCTFAQEDGQEFISEP